MTISSEQVRPIAWSPQAFDCVGALYPREPWCIAAHFAAARQRGGLWVAGPDSAPTSAGVVLVDTAVLVGRVDEAWVGWLGELDLEPGYIVAPPPWHELIARALPRAQVRPFMLYRWPTDHRPAAPADADVRLLAPSDRAALQRLGEPWIWKHFGSAEAMLDESRAFGAFAGERLVSVAVGFAWSGDFEDLAVATHPHHRGEGWATRCTAPLAADVLARGRQPVWKTLVNNTPSRRVAEKVGFDADGAVQVNIFRLG